MRTPALAALLLAGALGAFASAPPAHAQSELASGEATAKTVVVTVNGTEVTLGEIIAVRQTLPEQYQQLSDDVLMRALISQIADQTMLETAAAAAGLDAQKAFRIALRNQSRAVLAEAYLTSVMFEEITQDAVTAAYQAQYVDIERPAEIKVSHILSPDAATSAGLRAELAAGADFAALAREHGTDSTRDAGGALGWIARGTLDERFEEAAFALAEGAISDPVETPFGWHLITVEAKRTKAPPPLSEVESEIIGALSEQIQTRVLQEAREAAVVVFPDEIVAPDAIRNDTLLID